ncbi:MAG TPA: type I-C CRISPR-associated protein Cas8c/Csd1 [Verrucomicrobiae bacterium]
MLLKLLYDLAQSRHLLDDLAFTSKAVRWIIELDNSGNIIGSGPQATGDDKRGKEFSCPQTTRPKVAGGVAEFLADGLTAVFGLDPDPEARMPAKKRVDRDANNAAKQADFWRQIEEAEKATVHPGLKTVLAFKRRMSELQPKLLRWGKAADAAADAKSAWWLRTASGSEVKLGPDNFVFRVNDRLLLEDEALRAYWRTVHANEVNAARGAFPKGLCLISGANGVPLAPTHNPKIQGVPNTPAFGAAIVSFDKPAFASYGFDQSLNAPASDEASTAYCVALNWLLDRTDHSLRLGQTTLCFWAQESEASAGLFARLLNRPDPQSVAQFIRSPWVGIERELARRDRFCAVTLAGNAGRVVVKHWLQVPLDQAVENFRQWFADLELFVPPRPQANSGKRRKPRDDSAAPDKESIPPLAVFRLACTTVREAKDLPPDVPAQLYRAALEGTAPSTALIKPILDQLHSRLVRDEHYNLLFDESRFALLRLILNRNRKDNTMEIKPKLTADTDDPAYNCGRLLAVFAATQDKAHEYKLEGAGVAERYFGTASVSPASVFPLLLRLNRHHLNKISKSERFAGHERFLQEQIQSILTLFKPEQLGKPPVFPRTLDLQAQGRFALGFYQQVAEDDAARKAAKPAKPEPPAE